MKNMTNEERLHLLETRLAELEQQLSVIGNQLATEREQVNKLQTEVQILKEGGNL